MTPDLYWDELFEVIEHTLNPRRKRTRAPPSKRITKRKPKAKTRVRQSSRRAPKRAAKRPHAKKKPKKSKSH